MNRNLKALENELQRLTPRRLSTRTIDAIENAIARHPAEASAEAPRKPVAVIVWLRLAAAVVVLAAGLALLWRYAHTARRQPQPARIAVEHLPAAPDDVFRPVSAGTFLLDRKEEGPLVRTDWGPARRVRYRFVDHREWRNARSGATFRSTVPRDEVILVSLETN